MNFRPLGDRVLIRPEPPSDISEGGIHLVEARKPDECGQVVAVGEKHGRIDLDDALASIDSIDIGPCGSCAEPIERADIVAALKALRPAPFDVKVGDTVLFSWAAGQEITVDDGKATYLLMRESDLLAVVED